MYVGLSRMARLSLSRMLSLLRESCTIHARPLASTPQRWRPACHSHRQRAISPRIFRACIDWLNPPFARALEALSTSEVGTISPFVVCNGPLSSYVLGDVSMSPLASSLGSTSPNSHTACYTAPPPLKALCSSHHYINTTPAAKLHRNLDTPFLRTNALRLTCSLSAEI